LIFSCRHVRETLCTDPYAVTHPTHYAKALSQYYAFIPAIADLDTVPRRLEIMQALKKKQAEESGGVYNEDHGEEFCIAWTFAPSFVEATASRGNFFSFLYFK